MTQSKYLITTTNTPNSIVKRDQAGDIQGNSIYLTDQLIALSVTTENFLGAASNALFIDLTAATFEVPVVNANFDISGLSLTAGVNGISSAGVITGSYYDYGTITASQDLDFQFQTVLQATIGASLTFTNATTPPAGTFCYLILKTTGTTSRTVTFSSADFRTTATISTGVNSGRTITLNFVSDGVKLSEVSRTSAMV
ncbi:MAG: hypothetical protein EBU08_10075 [Micrococcales bacterium]|nr:hypothetical protein [Micrococcales bacterium]